MLNLRMTRETWNPEHGPGHQIVVSLEVPDDPIVIAAIVGAAAEAMEKHNKPKPGGNGGGPLQYVPVVGGGSVPALNSVTNRQLSHIGNGGAGGRPDK